MHSNFITPPDFISEALHTVLLIDPTWQELESIAVLCKTGETDFNVYVYDETMNDIDWLLKAANQADAVIVNTVPSSCSATKDRLVDLSRTYYYGPKNFLSNQKQIAHPQDYFIEYVRQQNTTPAL